MENRYPSACQRRFLATSFESKCNIELNANLYSNLLEVYNKTNTVNSALIPVNVETIYERNLGTNEQTLSSDTTVTTSYNNCVCSNALLEANYVITTTNDQRYMTSISVDIVVGNIGTTGCASSSIITASQKFSVKFQTGTTGIVNKSGNPGYIVGKPVLFGSLNSDNSIDALSSGFTLSGTSLSGECLTSAINSANLPTVNFRRDLIHSCYIPMTFSELSSYCANANKNVPIFTSHETLTHVAKFGNPDPGNLDD